MPDKAEAETFGHEARRRDWPGPWSCSGTDSPKPEYPLPNLSCWPGLGQVSAPHRACILIHSRYQKKTPAWEAPLLAA